MSDQSEAHTASVKLTLYVDLEQEATPEELAGALDAACDAVEAHLKAKGARVSVASSKGDPITLTEQEAP